MQVSKRNANTKIRERVRIEEEAEVLMAQVQQGDKVMVALDDQIGTLQKQIEDLLGGDNNGLMGAINELQIRIATSQDRLDESSDKDAEEAEELKQLTEASTSAIADLEAFEKDLKEATIDLRQALASLEEAKKEEGEVRKALESSGSESAELTRALSKATEGAEAAQASLIAAQSLKSIGLQTQAEMLGEQLSEVQEAAESARLALAESEHEGEQLSENAPEQDRTKLAERLHAAQRSEAKTPRRISSGRNSSS